MVPLGISLVFLNTRSPVGGTVFGRIRRCDFMEGGMSQGVGCELSKVNTIFS